MLVLKVPRRALEGPRRHDGGDGQPRHEPTEAETSLTSSFLALLPPQMGRLAAAGIVRLALVRAYGRVSGMSTTSNPYRGFRFPAEISTKPFGCITASA